MQWQHATQIVTESKAQFHSVASAQVLSLALAKSNPMWKSLGGFFQNAEAIKCQKRERALVHNLPDTLVLESILARRCVPTLGGLWVRPSVSCSVVSASLSLCPWDSPGKKMEWAAILFSRVSSQPRDRTQVSCIAGRYGHEARWSKMIG